MENNRVWWKYTHGAPFCLVGITSEVLPADFLQDLNYTYLATDAGASDLATLAEEILRTCEMRGKYLQALSEQAGGGFEAAWYERLLTQTRTRLRPFLSH